MNKTLLTESLESLGADGVSLNTQELIAYQSYAHLLNLKPSQKVRAQLSGGYLSSIKGRGMEFDEARHYQAGDDIRAIDWRVTARTGKTHTKVYREERERPVFILCDFRATMRFGTQFVLKSIQGAHLASLIAWSAIKRGDKVGALIFDNASHQEIKPKARKRAVLSLTQGLVSMHARAQPTRDSQGLASELEQACLRLRRLAKPGSLVYVLSDFAYLSASAVQHIGQLKRHCEVQAVHIYDPLEKHLPDSRSAGSVTLFDGTMKSVLSLGDRIAAQKYAQQRESEQCEIKDALSPHVARFGSISAGLPLTQQLIQAYSQQGLVES